MSDPNIKNKNFTFKVTIIYPFKGFQMCIIFSTPPLAIIYPSFENAIPEI